MKDLLNGQTLISACPFLSKTRVFFFENCPSTNAAAKEWVAAGNAGTALFVAAAQTAGRGRMGKSFYSPDESGVYFTLAKTVAVGQNPVGITCAAAVAAMRTIRKLCGAQCKIKWVNDLLYKGKKVCGILTEMMTCGKKTAILIGIGVNLRPAAFPPELSDIAGSLEDETTPRAALIADLSKALLAFLEDPAPENWLEDYRNHSCVLGRHVVFLEDGNPTEGEAIAVEEDGALLVQTAQGLRRLSTGEITLRTI